MQEPAIPLCVDLDGTLLKSDSLWEGLTALTLTRPWRLPGLLLALPSGKAAFKRELARLQPLDPAALPYRPAVLEWLKRQRAEGRPLVLATAADRTVAEAVARHLGLFDKVLASDGTKNFSGQAKGDGLAAAYGERGFDYAGDSPTDLAVWRRARQAVLVNPSRWLERLAEKESRTTAIRDAAPAAATLLRALRADQWSKNVLLWIPLLAAHQTSWARAQPVFVAFCAFCLTASAVYLLNDAIDLRSDRGHIVKRQRPFAAGDLPLWLLPFLLLALAAGSAALCRYLPQDVGLMLLSYAVVNLGYSAWFKKVPIVDVVVLTCFYTLRLYVGGSAVGVPISFWLTAFSLFLFSSLAFAKRYVEVALLRAELANANRGYRPADAESLFILGACSGLVAIAVLGLYIHSPEVARLYLHPERLWLLCPLALCWVSRVWLLVRRGDPVRHDPFVFFMRDMPSYIVALAGAAIVSWATF
jgi:4-hydroxybenzoate polyprenyltransferase